MRVRSLRSDWHHHSRFALRAGHGHPPPPRGHVQFGSTACAAKIYWHARHRLLLETNTLRIFRFFEHFSGYTRSSGGLGGSRNSRSGTPSSTATPLATAVAITAISHTAPTTSAVRLHTCPPAASPSAPSNAPNPNTTVKTMGNSSEQATPPNTIRRSNPRILKWAFCGV